MTPELQQRLYDEFPELFRERHLSVRESAMPWGLQCSDGWYNVVWAMCRVLCWRAWQAGQELDWREESDPLWSEKLAALDAAQATLPTFTTIKEKFGCLRIYHNALDPYSQAAIDVAEVMSSVTCEECGSPGQLHDTGWLFTHCDRCHRKRLISKGLLAPPEPLDLREIASCGHPIHSCGCDNPNKESP